MLVLGIALVHGHGSADTKGASHSVDIYEFDPILEKNRLRFSRVDIETGEFSLRNTGWNYQYLRDYTVCSSSSCHQLEGFLAPEVTADLQWDGLKDSHELALYRAVSSPRDFGTQLVQVVM